MSMAILPTAELPVPFERVKLTDLFWAPRQEINRLVTIPHISRWCEATGRFAAWDQNWKPGEPHKPHIFWDSDVMKLVEAASYSLAISYDASLDNQLDAFISRVVSAQQPDGYVNTYFTAVEPDRRFTNLRDNHELYCAGHLFEASVAHHRATGKRTLLDVACRYADHIESQFGREPEKKRGYCGHEEIELALVKLYRATGEQRYLRLSSYFVDERGRQPHYFDLESRARGEDPGQYYFGADYAYNQAHLPIREQSEVVGHSVRAMYLYSAVADLAVETGDNELLAVGERLWHHLTSKRLYVTGGLGSSGRNEGFTSDYDLPNESAYSETCAAIGLAFWSQRMLTATGNGKYADILERVLYNGAASSVSLDGQRFFYVNPLASRGDHHRQEGFDCACCPPNIARLMASIGGYFYSCDEQGASVHMFAQGAGRMEVAGQEVVLAQKTNYPWDGKVDIQIFSPTQTELTLRLRLPAWCCNWGLRVNGEPVFGPALNGYIHLRRRWKPGDIVSFTMDMPVRHVYAHPNIRETAGRAAIQRGPIIYCLEGVDQSDINLHRILIPKDGSSWRAEYHEDSLGGIALLRGNGLITNISGWENELYRDTPPDSRPFVVTAVPYCVWDNRSPGEMAVWQRTT